MNKDTKIKELEEEVEELSIQLSDMLCVALILSGVSEDKVEKALDLYIEEIDEDSVEYGVNEILANIQNLKNKHGELFK